MGEGNFQASYGKKDRESEMIKTRIYSPCTTYVYVIARVFC